MINVYAETEEKYFVKDKFYNRLEQIFNKALLNDIKIVLDDFNAKIGRETIHRPVISKESLHELSNNNGLRVVDFATSKNLVVFSTYFPRKDIYK